MATTRGEKKHLMEQHPTAMLSDLSLFFCTEWQAMQLWVSFFICLFSDHKHFLVYISKKMSKIFFHIHKKRIIVAEIYYERFFFFFT